MGRRTAPFPTFPYSYPRPAWFYPKILVLHRHNHVRSACCPKQTRDSRARSATIPYYTSQDPSTSAAGTPLLPPACPPTRLPYRAFRVNIKGAVPGVSLHIQHTWFLCKVRAKSKCPDSSTASKNSLFSFAFHKESSVSPSELTREGTSPLLIDKERHLPPFELTRKGTSPHLN